MEYERFKSIMDVNPANIYIASRNHDMEYANPVVEKEFGSYAGKTIRWDFFLEKNNRYYDILDTPITNPDGTVSKFEIFFDITDRKKSEEVLKEKESQLRQIIDLVPHFIFVKDETGKFEIVNKATAEVFGTTVEDLTGRRDSDFVATEEEKKFFRADDLEVISSGKTKFIPEEVMIDSENNIRYLETTKVPFHFSATDKPSLLGIAVDITERKLAEEALKESEEKLRSVIKSMDDIVFVLDEENYFVSVYAGEKNLLIKPEMFLGKKHDEFMPEHVNDLYNKAIINVKTGKTEEYEYNLKMPEGVHWYSLKLSPIFDNSKFAGSVAVVRDITERKENENLLQKSKEQLKKVNARLKDLVFKELDKSREKDRMMMIQSRQAAMGEMIGSIAHQWRQPLNEIGLYIQNLQDRFEQNELSSENLNNTIEKTMLKLEYLSQTIDDFRNFFRSDKEKRKFSLTESIKKTLSLTEASFKNHFIDINVNLQENLFITGYSNEFSQAVLNILNNAKDVLIERKIEKPYVKIKLTKTEKKINLTIADNAGGIFKEIMDKIFEPYFTTKSKTTGTGLGLYISKTIIERNMEGKLSVKNIKNGAEFKIEF